MLLLQFLRGFLFATSLVSAILFARFYRRTGDRFFGIFALAFLALALNWVGVAFVEPHNEARTWVFGIRLTAFLLIIAAIVDKNRKR
jgi:hypothetical protein